MAAALLIAAAAVLTLAAREYLPRLWRRIQIRRQAGQRLVECAGCGCELPVRKAAILVDEQPAPDGGLGGTVVSTEWHRRCLRTAQHDERLT